ncbi:Retrovirus-related Pol Polyprotein from transposon 308 [Phytophthora megakarya]|uniref:Retrovirus-related Pol Polyprotein from transposon 308 n=1 Tax=Phytophthora megakarya TaxID=4795 RepID=A0A225WTW8_9STRA|nr:Retrovirus-related Pol Polyprotein from transposon 308 [Phytophthora megakarya]
MTDAKVYTPIRVPQGCSDADLHLQASVKRCFAKLLYKHLLIWIDDLLLYAEDVDTYRVKLGELFSLMNEFKFKLAHRNQAFFNDP